MSYDDSIGRCACGCGERTKISSYTDYRSTQRKGHHLRYVKGHNSRLSPIEYIVDESTGCWIWQRSVTGGGYGSMRDAGKIRRSHVVYYERKYGRVPPGLELDHLCRRPSCVNPDHLEAVTHKQNMERGEPAQRTHCKRGHPLSGSNIQIHHGSRTCRQCAVIRARAATERKRNVIR